MSESEVTINVLADGPLEVAGPSTIKGSDGSTLKAGDKAYLCRCGDSANKPFCDGSHKREGFSDPGLGKQD